MKRVNAPPIPEGIRIKLSGEQEWKDVMQVFEDAGWRWVSTKKPTENIWLHSTEESIVTIEDNRICVFSPDNIIITELTATEFLNQYQGTIEYEPGDWVVFINDGCFCNVNQNIGDIVQILENNSKPHQWEYKTTKGDIASNYPINTRIRPATPEEIASVTKEPDVYIWDGDVLPNEYWVENPNKATCEIAQYLKLLPGGKHWNGDGDWYKVDPKNVKAHGRKKEDDLPIVPYELWKSILQQPTSQAEPVKERMFKKGDRIKVVSGIYKGCLGVITDVGLGSLYWVDLDSGDKNVILFSGETGTSIDMVHYNEEPVAIKPRYHIDNVMDQNIAISCPTIELWEAVTGLMPNNRLRKHDWEKGSVNGKTAGCVIDKWGGSYCSIEWYKKERYLIITAEEFLRDNGVAVPQPKWSIVTTDGVTVYEGDKVWWLYPNGDLLYTKPSVIRENYNKNNHYLLFNTFKAAEEYRNKQKAVEEWKAGDRIERIVCPGGDISVGDTGTVISIDKDMLKVKWDSGKTTGCATRYAEKIKAESTSTEKEMWKVGDILPQEWLNSVDTYDKYKGNTMRKGGYNSSRKVEKVKEDGWALISDTATAYLAPKDQYPTYPKAGSPDIVAKDGSIHDVKTVEPVIERTWKIGDKFTNDEDAIITITGPDEVDTHVLATWVKRDGSIIHGKPAKNAIDSWIQRKEWIPYNPEPIPVTKENAYIGMKVIHDAKCESKYPAVRYEVGEISEIAESWYKIKYPKNWPSGLHYEWKDKVYIAQEEVSVNQTINQTTNKKTENNGNNNQQPQKDSYSSNNQSSSVTNFRVYPKVTSGQGYSTGKSSPAVYKVKPTVIEGYHREYSRK